MFGISAFAQAPYSSLGIAAYNFNVTEDIALDDSSAQFSEFLQDFIENTNVADVVNNVGFNFFGSATETISFADSSTQLLTKK